MKTFNTTLIFALAGALTLSAASAEASNYGDKEAGYDGTVNTTVSGKTCHTWSEIAEVGPNKFDRMNTKWKATYNGASLPNHNFCRNPDSSERAWCYIKDATTTQVQAGEIAATWEYCNVDAAVAVSETPVAITCGAGTKLEGSECVAEPVAAPEPKIVYVNQNNVRTTTGTIYVSATNTCEVHPNACGKNTFLKNGRCVPGQYGKELPVMKSCYDGNSENWWNNNVTPLQQICTKL